MNHAQLKRVLARARGQYGVLSTQDAQALNMQWRALRNLALDLGGKSWYRGTVQVPGTWDPHLSRCAAAAAATGPGTVITGRSGARCWGLTSANDLPIRLLIGPGQTRPSLHRVAAYRASTLEPEERTTVGGIPVASVNRMLLDMARQSKATDEAAGRPPEELAEVIAMAVQRKFTSLAALHDYLAGPRRRWGTAELSRALTLMARDGITDSRFERRVRAWLRAHGFEPAPGTFRLTLPTGRAVWIDIAFPAEQVGLEVDGLPWHGTPQQQHADIWREREIEETGWIICRVSEKDIHDPEARFIAYLAELLRDRRRELTREA